MVCPRVNVTFTYKKTYPAICTQWLKRSVPGPWPRRPRFDHRSFHMRFVRTLRQVFLTTTSVLSALLHQCSILIFIYMLLLPEGQMGEAREASKHFGNRGESDIKVLLHSVHSNNPCITGQNTSSSQAPLQGLKERHFTNCPNLITS